MSVSVVSFE